MASPSPLDEPSNFKKKRKATHSNNDPKRKLSVGHSVEVRSTEEGFEGSWHAGSIIEVKSSKCRVRYDHILLDNKSDYYTELIKITPTIKDVETRKETPLSYRGLIRPKPPPSSMYKWGLHYGLCVDYYYKDAWWEGVVFDYEDGSEERCVFFPDIGDQHMAKFGKLRITQDWDEASDEWKPRGRWLFLELIEEHEDWPLIVSVRQLWNDIRGKKVFKKSLKEWTCLDRSKWEELVLEVLRDNMVLTAQRALSIISPSTRKRSTRGSGTKSVLISSCRGVLKNQVEENKPLLALPAPEGEDRSECNGKSSVLRAKRRKVKASADVASEGEVEKNSKSKLVLKKRQKPNGSEPKAMALDNVSDDPLCATYETGNCRNGMLMREVGSEEINDLQDTIVGDSGDSLCNELGRQPKKSKLSVEKWLPAGKDIVPEPKYCPDALANYVRATVDTKRISKDKSCENPVLKLRMHLAHIGWKVECKKRYKNSETERIRYIDPNGKPFYSLPQVCKHLTKTLGEFQTLSSQNIVAGGTVISHGDGLLSYRSPSSSSSESSSCRSSSKEQAGTSLPANGHEINSPVDTEISSPVASKVRRVREILSDEVQGSVTDVDQGDISLTGGICGERKVLDRDSSGSYTVHPLALSTTVIGSVAKVISSRQPCLRKGVRGLVPCGGSRSVDPFMSATNCGVLANGLEASSPVDITETSSPVVGKVQPMMEMPLEEVQASVIDDDQGDNRLTGGICGEKKVLDRDYLGSDSVHPLVLSTTVIGSGRKSDSVGQPCLRKEEMYGLVPCEGSRRDDSLVRTVNRGVLYIPEDQLALFDCVVQRYGPLYGDTLHISVAYFVNLFAQQLMAVISDVNSCCMKTLNEAILEGWETVVATSLNLGFTVGWLRDHLIKLRVTWERNISLDRMRLEYSETSEKFESFQARATLLRGELANVETELSRLKATLSSKQKAIADMKKLAARPPPSIM